jgi:hypothetical protein
MSSLEFSTLYISSLGSVDEATIAVSMMVAGASHLQMSAQTPNSVQSGAPVEHDRPAFCYHLKPPPNGVLVSLHGTLGEQSEIC